MTEREATLAVIGALNELAIPYMLVGSFSTSFSVIPRLTHDADFVISIGDGSLAKFAQHLGPDLILATDVLRDDHHDSTDRDQGRWLTV